MTNVYSLSIFCSTVPSADLLQSLDFAEQSADILQSFVFAEQSADILQQRQALVFYICFAFFRSFPFFFALYANIFVIEQEHSTISTLCLQTFAIQKQYYTTILWRYKTVLAKDTSR